MSNRTAKTIKMLEILKDGRKYKKEELANLIDTNPRNIIEYRRDLYDAGYNIEFNNGKNGGYYLDFKSTLPTLNLSSNEKTALLRSYDFLNNSDFFHLKDFNDALIKIKANFDSDNVMHESYIHNAKPKDIDLIDQYYKLFSQAISNRHKISMCYTSIQSNSKKKITVHPYELIRYQNFWYLIARDESSDKKFKIYKLSARMSNVKILEDQPFYYDEDFKPEDYIGKTSIIKLESYDVVIEAYGPTATSLSEKMIGLNPVYEWTSHDTLILRTKIEGRYNAIGLILSLGANAKLLEPEGLVNEIREIVSNMHEFYSGELQK